MDIKPQNNQAPGASAASTPSTDSLGPSSLFSQIAVRTMLQDLETIEKTPGAAPKTAAASTLPASLTQPKKEEPLKKPALAKEEKSKALTDKKTKKAQVAEAKERLKKEAAAKAKKIKEEQEAKIKKAKEAKIKLAEQAAVRQKKLKEASQKAKDLLGHQLSKEAIIELAKITNDPEAGWWLKLKARSLANKAQKQLDKTLITKPIVPAPAKITPPKPIEAAEPLAAEIETLLKTTLAPPPTPVAPIPAPAPTPPAPAPISPPVQPASPKTASQGGRDEPAAPPIKSAAPPPGLPFVAPAPIPAPATAPAPAPPAPTPKPTFVPSPPSPKPTPPPFAPSPVGPNPASIVRPIPLPPSDLTKKPSQISAPKPPSSSRKKWVWLLGGAVILLLIIIPLALFFFSDQPASSPQASATPSTSPSVKPAPSPPVALFKMDSQQVLAATAQTQSLAESMNALSATDETTGNFVQVLIKITDSQNGITYADLTKAAQLLNLNLFAPATSSPDEIIDQLKAASFSLFTYVQDTNTTSSPFNTGQNQTRAGLIVALKETASADDLYSKLKSLEPTLSQSLSGLFLGRQPAIPSSAVFLDNAYKNTAIRYLNLPQDKLSIDYAVAGHYLIFTTSKDAMYAALDRIFAEKTGINTSSESASPAPAGLLP